MNKKVLFFLLIPFLGFSQVQIGQDIDGVFLDELSGTSVSLSDTGNILAVGGDYNVQNGIVRIYENVSGVWTQIGSDILGIAQGDYSGRVALSANGGIVAIGAPGNDTNGAYSGHVRVYENILGVWKQIGGDINGEAAGDWFGNSISLSDNGNVVAVGAHNNDNNGMYSGHVRVFENISGVWTQIGADIQGDYSADGSGTSVSLSSDGTIIAIGSPQNGVNQARSGYVKIYKKVSGIWTQIGNKIQGESYTDRFGISVSLSDNGNIVAIGAPYNDANAINSGRVKIYENISNSWFQIGNSIDGISTNDENGNSVSLSGDGNIVVVGATQDIYGSQYTKKGYVRIFKNISGVWSQIGQTIEGEAIGDYSAKSVSISSDSSTLAIGAPYNNGNNVSGHVRVYDILGILSTNEFVSQNFNIYPNPTSDILNISLENNLVLEQVTIYNNLGKVVKTTNENVIDVSHLAKGLYFVEVITNQGKATKKVVIK